MRSNIDHVRRWSLVVSILIVFVGCATAPPAKSVTSLAQVAGTWEGTVSGPGNNAVIKSMVVQPDGTWELELASGNPLRHKGRVQLIDGKLRSRSETTGNSSTWTLHEGDGKRVLKSVNDDGRVSAELTPKR